MKITNDVNNNADMLSNSNKENDNASLLGSLFSINFNSNEVQPNNISDDLEFVLDVDEIKIIDYLSYILPNLNISNLDSSGLKNFKSEIQSDQSIKSEFKDKVLGFLDSVKNYNQNIFIKFHDGRNFKTLKNKSFKVSPIIAKNIGQNIVQNEQKSLKGKSNNKNSNEIIKSLDELNNHQLFNSKNKKVNFVKNIKKNDHPNKIYQSLNPASFQNKENLDLKFSKNINSLNSKLNEDLKANKINEIKVSDKFSSMQNLIEAGKQGNQFSQQNNTSFTNGGYNSILEGLLETLDLTQKGWTAKLVSRIENALTNGEEGIEFNLKPKNLGKLKVSISLKNGIGSVKITTENTFVTSALTQNENHLHKLFNDQGIDLEFLAHDQSQNYGSKDSFNKKSKNNNDQNNFLKSENEIEKTNMKKGLDDNVSSRHIVNVIA